MLYVTICNYCFRVVVFQCGCGFYSVQHEELSMLEVHALQMQRGMHVFRLLGSVIRVAA